MVFVLFISIGTFVSSLKTDFIILAGRLLPPIPQISMLFRFLYDGFFVRCFASSQAR